MSSFNDYLAHGNAWLFIPAAIVLGALHGLEPGHSKTMMAAFIIAVRGTVKQAMLLGLAATISHTAVIWLLALVGLHYAGQFDAESTEPYFQLATGIIVIGMAFWMFARTRREQRAAEEQHHHHSHGTDGGVSIETVGGRVTISIFEDNVPPRFRLAFEDGKRQPLLLPANGNVSLETVRPDGRRQTFAFAAKEGFLESTADIPEPHEFEAVLKLAHSDGTQTYSSKFEEHHHHDHSSPEYQDEHEREHAAEMQSRFANRQVTTGQIVLFGLTGGLMPCPSAFAVLMVCLQLKQFTLGFALVLAFSIGLAITLVSVGSVAALSVQQATKRFKGFGELARKAPYVSAVVMILIGVIVAAQGVKHLLH